MSTQQKSYTGESFTSRQLSHELTRMLPLMEPMHNVPQDLDWHAEGDVWTHAQMVRKALENIPAFQTLPEAEKNIMRLAAALHDIGKPTTTTNENGRWKAPGHGRRGSEILDLHWWQDGYNLPSQTRELITRLVRYHGRPLHGENRLNEHVASTSVLVRCDLLAILAEADIHGRICPTQDKEAALLQIDLFRETAKELNCFSQPYTWPNQHARWKFLQDQKATLHWHAPDDRKFSVHILCGLPGSGKTFLSKQLALPTLSRDEIRANPDPMTGKKLRPGKQYDEGRTSHLFQETLREHLRKASDFIVDGTNIIKNLRGNIIDLCANYGARIEIHFLDRDRDTILRQNQKRKTTIPETAIERMAKSLEKPDLTECHQLHNH